MERQRFGSADRSLESVEHGLKYGGRGMGALPQQAAEWLQSTPSWAVSALFHLLLIGFLISMVTREPPPPPKECGPISVSVPMIPPREAKPLPYDPTRSLSTLRAPKIPGPLDATQRPGPKKLFNEDGEITPDIPKGTDFSNNTDKNIQEISPGLNDRIGLGGDAASIYGDRIGIGRVEKTGDGVGSEESEDAVRAALEWLRRHQSPDGSWKSRDYLKECKKACRNLDPARYGDGGGFPEHDAGVTGLAMLAFTGHGHTHFDGAYEEWVTCLRKAVEYLKGAQVHSDDPSTNGRYGPAASVDWIYGHAIATLAMSELFLMTNDILGLKKSVTDAVRLCLRAQNVGRGWRYGVKPGDSDTSVTGWMVLALKTAKVARLGIPDEEFQRAFVGARNWFDYATSADGKTGYLGPGDAGSMLNIHYQKGSGLYPYSKDLSCMTAVSVLCRLFSSEKRQSPAVKKGVKILMKELPRWQEGRGRSPSAVNMYYWYYGSYALFQYGGPEWIQWNKAMLKALLDTQRKDPKLEGLIDEDGSWDSIDEWGAAGGRVYSTALGALTLEVYYRYRLGTK